MSRVFKFTGQIIKNLFSPPATTKYPDKPAVYYDRTRGHINIDINQCILCGICSRVCPSDAIKVDRNSSKWEINRFDCVQCGYCVDRCPKKCLEIIPGYPEPQETKSWEEHDKPVPKENFYPFMDKEKCVYCTLCAKKCPQGALEVDRKEKIWKLDESKCVSCEICVGACPKKCIDMKKESEIKKLRTNEAKSDSKPAVPEKTEITSNENLYPEMDKSLCVYCTLCAKKCPASALKVDRQAKTWELNKDSCISCGLCKESCPKKCIEMK